LVIFYDSHACFEVEVEVEVDEDGRQRAEGRKKKAQLAQFCNPCHILLSMLYVLPDKVL